MKQYFMVLIRRQHCWYHIIICHDLNSCTIQRIPAGLTQVTCKLETQWYRNLNVIGFVYVSSCRRFNLNITLYTQNTLRLHENIIPPDNNGMLSPCWHTEVDNSKTESRGEFRKWIKSRDGAYKWSILHLKMFQWTWE
jgi:hypothetical protein